MASTVDDLPSCSKMPTEGTKVDDIIINKIPVVLLTKLDPDIVSMKVITVDEKQNVTTTTQGKKKSYVNDDDALSDVSITFSDSDDTPRELSKSSKKKENTSKRGKPDSSSVKYRNGNVFSSQKSGTLKKTGQIYKTDGDSSASYKHRNLKRTSESAEGDNSSWKKNKAEMTVENIIGPQVMISKPDKPHNGSKLPIFIVYVLLVQASHFH